MNLDFLKNKWPSGIVARGEIGRFTGGLISPGAMANYDSRGEGPSRIRIGARVAYPVDGLIKWLETRLAPMVKADEE